MWLARLTTKGHYTHYIQLLHADSTIQKVPLGVRCDVKKWSNSGKNSAPKMKVL